MSLFRAGRGCGGLVARIVLVAMLAIVGLICVANRSWIEAKAINAIYGGRPQIHAGKYFEPGATVKEDGVRQTAVLVKGKPHVRVTSPTPEWRRQHKDATCKDDVCTAPATEEKFLGSGGIDLVGILAGLLVCYLVWVLLVDNDGPGNGRNDGYGGGSGRYGRSDGYGRYDR